MSAKKGVLIGVTAICVLFLAAVGFQVMAIGRENSSLEAALKVELDKHSTADQLQQKLTELHYSVTPNADGSLSATGDKHSIVIYSSWLTVSLRFSDGKNTGYDIERASSWF